MTNIIPAKKFANTPIGSPPPIAKYNIFLIAMTIAPATGEKIKAAIKAGTSLKSIFKYGGKNGSGKLRKSKTREIAPKSASIINFNSFDDCLFVDDIIDLLLHLYIDSHLVMKDELFLCFIFTPLNENLFSSLRKSLNGSCKNPKA